MIVKHCSNCGSTLPEPVAGMSVCNECKAIHWHTSAKNTGCQLVILQVGTPDNPATPKTIDAFVQRLKDALNTERDNKFLVWSGYCPVSIDVIDLYPNGKTGAL